MPTEELCSLKDLDSGLEGMIRRVASDDALVLRYLGQRSLIPGNLVKVVEKEPFNGPMTLEIAPNVDPTELTEADSPLTIKQILGVELATKIFVVIA